MNELEQCIINLKLNDFEFVRKNYTDFDFIHNEKDKQFIPDPCKNCSNHPLNGGSGICHCTLGSLMVN